MGISFVGYLFEKRIGNWNSFLSIILRLVGKRQSIIRTITCTGNKEIAIVLLKFHNALFVWKVVTYEFRVKVGGIIYLFETERIENCQGEIKNSQT